MIPAEAVQVTAEGLNAAGLVCLPERAEEIAAALNPAFVKYGIFTSRRIAGFLGQVCQESDRFRVTVENLNYSAAGLLATWPKRLTPALAEQLAHQPEAIGNLMYGDRLGNGPESSGDGFRYRGRGYIQITGRENYRAFGLAIGEDIEGEPDRVGEPVMAALSAAWFWATHGLNEIADVGDVLAMTHRVNGGEIGLDGRRRYYAAALRMFGGEP
jgi:putative chitinase